MKEESKRPVGLTKDVGWQIGVRRTLPAPCSEVWNLLTSDKGLKVWLGALSGIPDAVGATYQLEDGARGEVRVLAPGSHLRLTWQPEGWSRSSTIQVRVIPKGDHRCVVAFHQEHLPDSGERERRQTHYIAALDELARLVHSIP